MKDEYISLCIKVADAEKCGALFSARVKDFRYAKEDDIIAILNLTIKTNKSAGEVVPRGIHASAAHPGKPGMRYVASVLQANWPNCRIFYATRLTLWRKCLELWLVRTRSSSR